MEKGKEKKEVVVSTKSGAGRSRVRRNTLERKCLSKGFKRLFIGSSRTVFLLALAAERGSMDRIGREAGFAAEKILVNGA